jgi:hypothetical protein
MTLQKPFLRLVGGTTVTCSDPVLPPRRRGARGPYQDRKPIEYQDGLPVIDPDGEQDKSAISPNTGRGRALQPLHGH